jgi:hypothetical protein
LQGVLLQFHTIRSHPVGPMTPLYSCPRLWDLSIKMQLSLSLWGCTFSFLPSLPPSLPSWFWCWGLNSGLALVLTRQALYMPLVLLLLMFFFDRVSCFCPGLALVLNPPIPASQEAGIRGMYHHTWIGASFLKFPASSKTD